MEDTRKLLLSINVRVRRRTGSFRLDYVTPDRFRAQDRTFGLAPIPAIQLAVTASRKRTLRRPRDDRLRRTHGSALYARRPWRIKEMLGLKQ